MPDTKIRRNLTPCQAAGERDTNCISLELVVVYRCHIRSPFGRASLSEDRNETGAGPRRRILERRKAASGLEHLKRDDRDRLEVLKDGAWLISIRNEHHADELAAGLHEDMPWMAPATEVVWRAMRRSVREGWPGLRVPPLLLDGPPGIGKSHWARRLGALLSTTTAVIEATGENASLSSARSVAGVVPTRGG